MVIEFNNRLPEPMKLEKLLQLSGLTDKALSVASWSNTTDTMADTTRYIAAYDCDELVGVGRIDSSESLLTGPHPDEIVVLPNYRNREIVVTISKLLHARKYSRPCI